MSDLILATFSFNEQRISGQRKLVDFPYLYPISSMLSILSSPQKYRKHDLTNILSAFTFESWILILITFTTFYCFLLMSNKSNSFQTKSKLFFDCLSILLGKGLKIIPGYFELVF